METVTLLGQARELGRQVGALSRQAMRARLAAQLGGEDVWAGLVVEHAARIAAYGDLLAGVAPHWLDEGEGMAEGAGLAVEVLLLANCPPPGLQPAATRPDQGPVGGGARPAEGAGNNCTAFMAIGSASGCGTNLLHKNRDERPLAQAFFVKQVEGHNRLLAGGEMGGLGVAQMVNEHGLAGANNTGSVLADRSDAPGLDDRQILRLVGERARCCEEALEVCEETVAAGRASCLAGTRGMIFLFADPARGLVVEMTPARVWHEFCDDGLVCRSNHFLLAGAVAAVSPDAAAAETESSTGLRYARAEELLRPLVGELRPEDFMAAGSDTANHPHSICNDSTVSMMTHELSADVDARVSWVCDGHPLLAEPEPWPHGRVETPVSFIDGAAWAGVPQRGEGA